MIAPVDLDGEGPDRGHGSGLPLRPDCGPLRDWSAAGRRNRATISQNENLAGARFAKRLGMRGGIIPGPPGGRAPRVATGRTGGRCGAAGAGRSVRGGRYGRTSGRQGRLAGSGAVGLRRDDMLQGRAGHWPVARITSRVDSFLPVASHRGGFRPECLAAPLRSWRGLNDLRADPRTESLPRWPRVTRRNLNRSGCRAAEKPRDTESASRPCAGSLPSLMRSPGVAPCLDGHFGQTCQK